MGTLTHVDVLACTCVLFFGILSAFYHALREAPYFLFNILQWRSSMRGIIVHHTFFRLILAVLKITSGIYKIGSLFPI